MKKLIIIGVAILAGVLFISNSDISDWVNRITNKDDITIHVSKEKLQQAVKDGCTSMKESAKGCGDDLTCANTYANWIKDNCSSSASVGASEEVVPNTDQKVAANDISCTAGKGLATELLMEKLGPALIASSGGKSNNITFVLGNIRTTYQNGYQTGCIGTVLLSGTAVDGTVFRDRPMPTQVPYTVSMTEDNGLYVEGPVELGGISGAELAQRRATRLEFAVEAEAARVRYEEKQAVAAAQQKLNSLVLTNVSNKRDSDNNGNVYSDGCLYPDEFVRTNFGCEIRGKQQGPDGFPIEGSATVSEITEAASRYNYAAEKVRVAKELRETYERNQAAVSAKIAAEEKAAREAEAAAAAQKGVARTPHYYGGYR